MKDQENSMGLIILGMVVGAAVMAVAWYFIARAMKGSMKLSIGRKNVSSGEPIAGSLNVTVRKALLADRLYVALIGERQVTKRSGSGNKKSWEEFYRDEADILMGEQLRAGFSKTFEFTLNAPSVEQAQTGAGAVSAMTKAVGDATDNELANKIASGVGQLASAVGSMSRGRRRWKVVSRLETKGVDLAASEKVQVSLKTLG